MKKIYLSLTGFVLCGSIIGQNTTAPHKHPQHKAVLAPNSKAIHFNSNNASRAAGAFNVWVEPVGDVMANMGVDENGGTTAPSQDIVIGDVYQDSTVVLSDQNGAYTVSNILLGSILDPKSTNLLDTFDPIATKNDPYSIDSIAIYGSYVKVTPAIDTLYIWLVWGDSTNANVFTKKLTNQVYVAPISTWRRSVIGAKITGATTAQGNKVKAAAPSSNMMLYRYALQNTDSVPSGGYTRYLPIGLPSPVNVPAGNIVSCFFTFVPGGTHNLGDCYYAFDNATVPQNVNGFAPGVWQQTAPEVNSLTDWQNQQVDPTSWCMGASYDNYSRYNTPPYGHGTFMAGDLISSPLIEYHLYGNSTQGVNEIATNGFALGQNTPNPFTNQTTINYQLKNAASNVAIEIYDIRGVKMFEKTQKDVRDGKYSVEIDNTNFASGIYFYSLTVDGKKATKKMIVQ